MLRMDSMNPESEKIFLRCGFFSNFEKKREDEKRSLSSEAFGQPGAEPRRESASEARRAGGQTLRYARSKTESSSRFLESIVWNPHGDRKNTLQVRVRVLSNFSPLVAPTRRVWNPRKRCLAAPPLGQACGVCCWVRQKAHNGFRRFAAGGSTTLGDNRITGRQLFSFAPLSVHRS